MATVAAIDVETSEAAVLFDYENIRISWERTYSRLFTYTDMCWLCELAENRFGCSIGRIMVCMSDPDECTQTCSKEQLEEMRRTLKWLQEDQARSDVQQAPASVRANREKRTVRDFETQREANNPVKAARSMRSDPEVQPTSSQSKPSLKPPDVVDLSSDDEFSSGSLSSDSSADASSVKSKMGSNSKRVNQTASSSEGDPPVSHISPRSKKWEETCCSTTGGASSDSSRGSSTKECSSTDSSRQTVDRRSDDDGDVQVIENASQGAAEMGNSMPSGHDMKPFTRLGIGACPNAEVIVRLFQYKFQKKMRVQKGCDVIIGSQVMSLCYMPRFSSIILFSADGDFEDVSRECVKASSDGGITRFAKPIRILGFSHAFERVRYYKARDAFRERRAQKLRTRAGSFSDGEDELQSSAAVNVYLLDFEFPVIRRVLERSARLPLPPERLGVQPYGPKSFPPPQGGHYRPGLLSHAPTEFQSSQYRATTDPTHPSCPPSPSLPASSSSVPTFVCSNNQHLHGAAESVNSSRCIMGSRGAIPPSGQANWHPSLLSVGPRSPFSLPTSNNWQPSPPRVLSPAVTAPNFARPLSNAPWARQGSERHQTGDTSESTQSQPSADHSNQTPLKVRKPRRAAVKRSAARGLGEWQRALKRPCSTQGSPGLAPNRDAVILPCEPNISSRPSPCTPLLSSDAEANPSDVGPPAKRRTVASQRPQEALQAVSCQLSPCTPLLSSDAEASHATGARRPCKGQTIRPRPAAVADSELSEISSEEDDISFSSSCVRVPTPPAKG